MLGIDARGVLIAGGAGSRLGLGIPKAMVLLGGTTLYDRAERLLQAITDEVVVAAPRGLALPPPRARVRRVNDRPEGGGPLAGIAAALEDGDFRLAIVLGVDFPFVSIALLVSMASRLSAEPELRAIVPAPGGRPQPLAAVYTREAGMMLVEAFEAGERSMTRALDRVGATVLDVAELQRGLGFGELPAMDDRFFNLNTPEDLAEAERRLAARAART